MGKQLLWWSAVLMWLAAPIDMAHAGLSDTFMPPQEEFDMTIRQDTAPVVTGYVNPVIDKAHRGLENVFTSPLEIPLAMRDLKQRKGWVAGILLGPVAGVGKMAVRCGSGLTDLITTPVGRPRRALWVKRQSLLLDETSRAEWVVGEAATAQRELRHTVEPLPAYP